MTDIEKIREEVEKLKSQLLRGACSSQIAMETMCKEEAYNEVLAILDTMQEEPVSMWHDASKKSDNPEDVVIINPSDNTGEVLTKCTGVNQGHIWAYTSELLKLDNPCNIGKNLQEPQVKESAEIQHVNDMCKENGNSLTQEPESEDLEEAADNALSNVLNTHEIVNVRSCLEMFRLGAKWQKEQMMKNAVEAVISQVPGLNEIVFYNPASVYKYSLPQEMNKLGLNKGDKVKLIIIKED